MRYKCEGFIIHTVESISRKFVNKYRKLLLTWYQLNRRNFPWRREIGDYHIIVTEILLQQTKAERVANYYSTFFHKYPSWEKLYYNAKTKIEKDLKPLGLQKQRAKRLKDLSSTVGPRGPTTEQLRNNKDSFPSIGFYISRCIDVFIFNKKKAVIDTNINRILNRNFGKREKVDYRYDLELHQVADKLVPRNNPKEFNWAWLDLGALICKPKTPRCTDCPINSFCMKYNV